MAQNHSHPGSLVPQETNFENADTPGISQPYSQSEVEDLLYGNDRSVQDRLERLREMRAEASERESGDFGGGRDPSFLIDELDRAIDALQRDLDNTEETGNVDAAMASDHADHLDALAPDDVDARAALIGEDEFYEDDEDGPADDDHAWHGSEEFDPHLH
jgi:hypothetical protein